MVGSITNNVPVIKAWEMIQSGEAIMVDVRWPSEFASGHPAGAISLPYSEKSLAQRLDLLITSSVPIILLTEGTEQTNSVASQLEGSPFILLGSAEGGIDNWSESNLPTETLAEVSPHDLNPSPTLGDVVLLDVREPIEWDLGYIPGALLISLGSLKDRLDDIPREANVTVICEAGIRSSSAASILQAAGFTRVAHVPEGTGGYRNAGLPLEFPDGEPG